MPKLLIFAPCEKALIDQSNNLSLVSVLQDVTVSIPEQNLPENALIPMKWDVVSLWLEEPGDGTKEFEQICELRRDDQIISRSRTTFSMQGPLHRVLVTNYGFPVQPPGQFMLILRLREMPGGQAQIVAQYPLRAEVKVQKPS